MIEPATRWFEIIEYKDKQADQTSNIVKKIWSCRYPMPIIIVYDCGNEFLGNSFKND